MNEVSKVENADPYAIWSVQFAPDGKTIVSGGARGRQYHALSRGFVCNELVRSSSVAAVAAYR